jgi:flagellar motor component MotA
MIETIKIILGMFILLVGIFIGNFLAKTTIEELYSGQRWFRRIILLSFIGAFFSLIFYKDIF